MVVFITFINLEFLKVFMIFANIIVAIVILLIGLALGKFAGRLVKRLVLELEIKKYFRIPIDVILSRGTSYIIYTIAVIISLIKLGISTVFLYIVLTAIIIVIGVSLIIALKNLIPNIIAGVTLQKRDFKKGDKIKVGDVEGNLEEFTLTETKIKAGNEFIFIPNSHLAKSVVRVKKH